MIIYKLELDKIIDFRGKNIIPVFLQFGNECYEIVYNTKHSENAWRLFQKIFYNKLSSANVEYFESIYDKKLFENSKHGGKIIFSKFSDRFPLDSVVKFAKNGYMQTEKESNCFNNLLILKKILKETETNDVSVYVAEKDKIASEFFTSEYKEIKKTYSKKDKLRYSIKKGNFVVGHINGLILSPQEKLIKFIKTEFKKHKLLGDIVLTKDQEIILNEYMKDEFIKLLLTRSSFAPSYRRMFALGLVRFAMKNYNLYRNGEFWPHFSKEYNLEIPGNDQIYIHKTFESVMKAYGFYYNDKTSNKIDNITMHSFVADNSASQLFDYIFDFWRLDLARNTDNLDTDDGKAAFDNLIDVIKVGASNNVMSHTSLLLEFKELKASFKNRVKRILKLMNNAFWDNKQINETGNRINRLLNEWTKDPKRAFLKEISYVRKHSNVEKGEILYRSPLFKVDFKKTKLYIILPNQRLLNCDENDYPTWNIYCESQSINCGSVEPEYTHDKISRYVAKTQIEIPFNLLLDSFNIVLSSNGKVLKKYKLCSSNIRMFDVNGRYIDYKNALIPEGFVFAYSNSEDYPIVLDEKNNFESFNSLKINQMVLQKGQVVVLDDKTGVQVNQKMEQGFSKYYPVNGAVLVSEGQEYKIYNNLPILIFNAEDDQISGVSLVINGEQNKIIDGEYKEFRLLNDVKTKGYLINLSDYIKDEGLYNIEITFPKYHKHLKEDNIAYIKNFNYSFNKNLYVFDICASISFNADSSIIMPESEIKNKMWSRQDGRHCFTFNIAEDNGENTCKDVKDGRLKRQYNLNGNLYDIYIEIPALYWKFSQNDVWNTERPANILLKELKDKKCHLYVKGPSNILTSKIVTEEDVDIADEASEIKFNGKSNPFFDISKIYEWFRSDRTETYRDVLLVLDGYSFQFFSVVCKSKLNNVSLIGDFKNNILKGDIDVVGNEDYTISIYYQNEIICEDEQIIDGHFEIETELKSGDYKINVYEIEENEDDGFDVETNSVLLNNEPIVKQIINLRELENCFIYINGWNYRNYNLGDIKFKSKHCLKDLQKTSFKEVTFNGAELYGICNENIDYTNVDTMSKFLYYNATFSSFDKDKWCDRRVLIIFTDLMNKESIIILARDREGDYGGLYINKSERKLITPLQHAMITSIARKHQYDSFDDEKMFYKVDIQNKEKIV